MCLLSWLLDKLTLFPVPSFLPTLISYDYILTQEDCDSF